MVAVAVALVGVTYFERHPHPGLPVVAGLSLAVCLPVLVCRRLPLAAAVMSAGVALIGMTVLGWPGRLVATWLFGMAAARRPRRPLLVLVASVAWVVSYGAFLPQTVGIGTVTDLIVLGVAPVAVGHALRLHRERAEQKLQLYHAEVQCGAADERAGLARDVHDSVGHHLTAIRMQALAARRALHGEPPTADRALGTIADLSATALAEVRAMLKLLHGEPRAAGPGLLGAAQLVERMSRPGLRIRLERVGSGGQPTPALDQTAYRVLQEALTNAARHSGATQVDVRIHAGQAGLTITVADDGPATPGPGPPAEGSGLRGMRERVLQHGGTLRAGPRQPHGWTVRAELPTEGIGRDHPGADRR